MCGIAGAVYDDPTRAVDEALLSRMAGALAHRGPDDRGVWSGPGVGLSHTRLSIIDLSPAGRQPMSNEDGSIQVVFNGEIYNFRELRQELVARGHQFRSATDTEVIVHLYEEKGADCVDALDGMFAFAIWDENRRELLLARDRIGKKPLKYVEIDGGILFASELKALLETGLVDRSVDPSQVDQYLSFGYVPAPGTGFERIRKLPPGHRLIRRDGRQRIERYWHLDFRSKERHSREGWAVRIREEVRAAVERRLVSDVPLGVILSGGIDSSIVTACMAQASDRPVQTFSIGFEEEETNELPFARQVAERYGTTHRELIVRSDDVDILPRIAELYEEPFADTSALPTYFLARETRKYVTVALNGDGGDEGFAGYERYRRLALWDRLGPFVRASGIRSLGRLLGRHLPGGWERRMEGVYHLSDPDLALRYGWQVRLFSRAERERLWRAPPTSDPPSLAHWIHDERAGASTLDRLLFTDSMSYLPDDLLVKVDLASMAHGLEARSPLLDHRVLELAASIPPELKVGSGLKGLLKQAFRDDLPAGVLARAKQGFGSPVQRWFRTSLLEFVRETLLASGARIHELLDTREITATIERHRSGRDPRGAQLWALIMLELWLRRVAHPTPSG
ncbi:MAG: asparagine synthase (glutamine-hydrolyzing) [Myxococcota bacterium]